MIRKHCKLNKIWSCYAVVSLFCMTLTIFACGGEGLDTLEFEEATVFSSLTAITNGGFENNLVGWTNRYGSVSISNDARSGSKACKCANAAGINSSATGVSGNARYRLRSYVKQIAGSGRYKVTIAWKNASGVVVKYDNDWKGSNKPTIQSDINNCALCWPMIH